MFTKAIVRKPAQSMIDGLTSAELGKPDHALGLEQHAAYVQALEEIGLDVLVLDAMEGYPDSCFVEDVALLTPHCAILTRPGAESRRGEVAGIEQAVRQYFDKVETIGEPGTIEAGDIMMVGDDYYIGLSERTNEEGANQMSALLAKYSLSAKLIEMSEMLHLKTGLSYLENNHLLACGEFIENSQFNRFNMHAVGLQDSYSANSVWINDTVLVPAGYPTTSAAIDKMGYKVKELEMSEFQKLDGGLSCLSLRF
ncbi:MAG: arginine deiminase family protein [Pseudomonadota bacterium]